MKHRDDEPFLDWVKKYRQAEDYSRAYEYLNLICLNITKRMTLFIMAKVSYPASEDVFQETLKAIVTSLDKFRGDTNEQFLKWCYRIARNKIIDHHRKQKRTTELDQYPEQQIERLINGTYPHEPVSPEGKHDLEYAMNLLAKSKPKCRELLWDHYVIGLDHHELAVQLELKKDAVRMRIERCLDTVKGLLGPAI